MLKLFDKNLIVFWLRHGDRLLNAFMIASFSVIGAFNIHSLVTATEFTWFKTLMAVASLGSMGIMLIGSLRQAQEPYTLHKAFIAQQDKVLNFLMEKRDIHGVKNICQSLQLRHFICFGLDCKISFTLDDKWYLIRADQWYRNPLFVTVSEHSQHPLGMSPDTDIEESADHFHLASTVSASVPEWSRVVIDCLESKLMLVER